MNDFNLEEALVMYRDLTTEYAPAVERLAELKKQIVNHVRKTGEVASLDGVQVTISPGQNRVKWNTKALEGFVVAHPELEALKTEYTTQPVVRLKVD